MDYLKKIQIVIDNIEGHLKDEVDLKEAIEVSGFSFFHFHRIFLFVVGESVAEYIRKRRLTEAAREIMTTDRRIIDIALDYQFSSQQSFSRAFKKAIGATPAECRGGDRFIGLHMKSRLTERAIKHHLDGGITMEPKIVELGEMKIVGLRYFGDNKNQEIAQVWQMFNKRIDAIKNQDNKCVIGYCAPGPEGEDKSKFEYVCSAVVDKVEDVPEGMVTRTIPPHKYAVFTHRGSLETLKQTYNYIYATWFPKSGLEMADNIDFEWYDDRFKDFSPDSEFDIYVPIK